VCLPLLGDQPDVAAQAQNHGAALVLDKASLRAAGAACLAADAGRAAWVSAAAAEEDASANGEGSYVAYRGVTAPPRRPPAFDAPLPPPLEPLGAEPPGVVAARAAVLAALDPSPTGPGASLRAGAALARSALLVAGGTRRAADEVEAVLLAARDAKRRRRLAAAGDAEGAWISGADGGAGAGGVNLILALSAALALVLVAVRIAVSCAAALGAAIPWPTPSKGLADPDKEQSSADSAAAAGVAGVGAAAAKASSGLASSSSSSGGGGNGSVDNSGTTGAAAEVAAEVAAARAVSAGDAQAP